MGGTATRPRLGLCLTLSAPNAAARAAAAGRLRRGHPREPSGSERHTRPARFFGSRGARNGAGGKLASTSLRIRGRRVGHGISDSLHLLLRDTSSSSSPVSYLQDVCRRAYRPV